MSVRVWRSHAVPQDLVNGRVLLIVAPAWTTKEPRTLVTDGDDTAQVYGRDVMGWGPSDGMTFDADVDGYPVRSLEALPAGDYRVQVVFNRYELFQRSDGRTLSLPPEKGEGQQWQLKPGNFVSPPRSVHLAPGERVDLTLDRVLPPVPERPDTAYVKHVKLRSEKLSRFWGRTVELGAIVLLPEGFQTHKDAHYPLMIAHGHFTPELWGWRETPPDSSLKDPDTEALKRDCPDGHTPGCERAGYPKLVQQLSYAFYKRWTGPDFPRVLLVQLEHANPFYDDSYAVNSANLGPYGDAITEELVPYIEEKFRGLGPWARGLYGGSTGGWEALAAQVFYPDAYNGVVANCPDPVDFHHYVSVNLYGARNAYFTEGPFRKTPRPSSRAPLGYTTSTMEQDNLHELALGTHSRSGGQYDIWEAVYSPVGPDGYPRRVYDKHTGAIDPETVRYWYEHYDLTHILARDWAKLGPKLQGKLRINVGHMDTYFLDGAVMRLDRLLTSAQNPVSEATVAYGALDGHCWSGDAEHPNFISRLTAHERFIPQLVEHFLTTAPAGADMTSWLY